MQTTNLEQSALSTMLSSIYADDGIKLRSELCEDDFSSDVCKKIFRLIKRYEALGYPLNEETIINDETITSNDVLVLQGSPCESADYLISKLRANRIQREGASAAEKIRNNLLNSPHSELAVSHIDEAIDKLRAIKELKPSDTWRQYNDIALDGFSVLSRRYKEKKSLFIETGYRKLDVNIGGLRPGNLIIIAARPGQGKTAYLLDILKNISERGIKSAFLSMEMSEEDIYNRQICKLTDIPIAALYNPAELWDSHWEKINEASETIHKWPIMFSDKPLDLPSTLSKCRNAARQGCNVIAIDQLSKVKSVTAKSLFEHSTEVVNQLSMIAKELKVTIILLCQINRKAHDTTSNEPELWQLKNTGALEEDADIILLIHRPWEYTQAKEDDGKAFIKIAKNRNGRTGTIEMFWVRDRCAFVE